MLLLDAPLTEQPQEAVEVDEEHPSAHGLLAGFVGTPSAIGAGFTPVGAVGIRPLVGLSGLANFDGASFAELTGAPRINGGAFTCIFGVVYNGQGRPYAFVSQGGASSARGWKLGCSPSRPDGRFHLTYGLVDDYINNNTDIPVGVPCVLGATVSGDGGTCQYYLNGRADGTATVGTMLSPSSRDLTIGAAHLGGEYVDWLSAGNGVYFCLLWDRALSADEVRAISANPWQLFRTRHVVLPTSAPAGVTGTSTVTLSLGGSATGTVRVAGTSNATLAITGTATGKVAVRGSSTASLTLSGTATAVAPVRGTSSVTLALTGSATGAVRVQGASTITLAITGSATGGTGANTGTSTVTLQLTGSATGRVLARGSSTATLALGGSATGVAPVRGASAATLSLGGTATGVARVQGASHATLALGGTATGRVLVRGASSVTLAIAGSATGTGPILTLPGLVTAVLTWRSSVSATLSARAETDATLTQRQALAAHLTGRPEADAALAFHSDDPV